MEITERYKSLISLGHQWQHPDDDFEVVIDRAYRENPWFTPSNIRQAMKAITDQFLSEDALSYLIDKYKLDSPKVQKRIGLVLPGNIPFVGFHDLLCCYLTGHISFVKMSEKDRVLPTFFIEQLTKIEPKASTYFNHTDKLKDYDAVIATGSNNAAVHFEYYFRNVPHIIRRNRNGIAIITGTETEQDLKNLADDIFSYFGLGCRNISKVYVPRGYNIERLFKGFEAYRDIILHNKYKNNFDYNVALFLLNKEAFLQNEFVVLRESKEIVSRIGSIHYEYYDDLNALSTDLNNYIDAIQCIVCNQAVDGLTVIPPGTSQSPSIDTYADNVDTIQFLLSL